MRIALDTNILAYAVGVTQVPADAEKVARSVAVIERLSCDHTLVLPTQVLGELFNVMTKAGFDRTSARDITLLAAEKYVIAAGAREQFVDAVTLATDARLQVWDALILVIAAQAQCGLLLSEDMQHGFTIRGVTIVNPFADPPHPALAALVG